ncbi:hypothetical protein F5Y06DRAFT_287482 [Hypoxylon sp. FL0890]|nr:hypothetical protein F5Y06DRAFT_287482 [Hypoxylon sp. FL0890]
MHLNGWSYLFLENYVYARSESPPRKRIKPMQVPCVEFPRCASESLQHALLKLDYDHTYHEQDTAFEEPGYTPQWVLLCSKKWFGRRGGECTITRAQFDAVLGHSVAVTGAAAAVFAADLIAAYPEAEVFLNYRKDIDAWHRSVKQIIARANSHWVLWLLSVTCALRGRGKIETEIARNGKSVYREHDDMIRGLVPMEWLLEWAAEDGWRPLCEFLGYREAAIAKRYMVQAVQNLVLLSAIAAGAWTMSSRVCINCAESRRD